MDTPILSHIKSTDYDYIYEPAEDSFLMLDALELDLALIKSRNPLIIAEIGIGSGVTITALAKSLSTTASNVFCFGTDINPIACSITKRTASINNVSIEVINMDLLSNFRSHLFDIIIFNPPYVVTDSEEIRGCGIERSWAGGIKGREITDRLLSNIRDYLSPNGLFYLVTIEENDPGEICEIMERQGFLSNMVLERRVRGEHLKIFRFSLNAI